MYYYTLLARCLTSLPSIFDRIYNIFWNPYLKTDGTSNLILFYAKDLKQEYIKVMLDKGLLMMKRQIILEV